jgi:SAM-dependent methyltransferase
MIALARKYDRPWPRLRYEFGRLWRRGQPGRSRWANSWPGLARLLRGQRCRFVVNPANNLALFPDGCFDLIYSSLVLQHMRPEYSLNYIKEFLRVLAPAGLMVFQIPSRIIPERELPYRASIRVESTALTVKPSETLTLQVWVKNVSDFTWPAVNLGNHWLNSAGEQVVLDDARAPLPMGMKPGQEVQVSFPVTALRRPGHYWLELDVVQESVLWFQTMGSPTLRIPCHVQGITLSLTELPPGFKSRLRAVPGYHACAQLYRRGLHAIRSLRLAHARAASPTRSATDFEPVMETYGVPKDELVKWIETHGGSIVDIQNDLSVGKDWESFRYYVTKPDAKIQMRSATAA